jgi:hypothetical protein
MEPVVVDLVMCGPVISQQTSMDGLVKTEFIINAILASL